MDATKKKSCRESQKKGAFSRKPLAEPWTQTLPIGNDFHKIQQADLFSYDKSQQNADQSKVSEKGPFPRAIANHTPPFRFTDGIFFLQYGLQRRLTGHGAASPATRRARKRSRREARSAPPAKRPLAPFWEINAPDTVKSLIALTRLIRQRHFLHLTLINNVLRQALPT